MAVLQTDTLVLDLNSATVAATVVSAAALQIIVLQAARPVSVLARVLLVIRSRPWENAVLIRAIKLVPAAFLAPVAAAVDSAVLAMHIAVPMQPVIQTLEHVILLHQQLQCLQARLQPLVPLHHLVQPQRLRQLISAQQWMDRPSQTNMAQAM